MYLCPQKQGLRYQELFNLKHNMDKKQHPAGTILYSCVQQWSSNSKVTPHLTIDDYATHIHDHIALVIKEQSQIGWNQALRGFLSIHWCRLAALDSANPKAKHINPDMGSTRIHQYLILLRTYAYAIWQHWNKLLHRKQATIVAKIRSATDSSIKHYHENGHLLLQTDRHLIE